MDEVGAILVRASEPSGFGLYAHPPLRDDVLYVFRSSVELALLRRLKLDFEVHGFGGHAGPVSTLVFVVFLA
jgi:hypothetical protein